MSSSSSGTPRSSGLSEDELRELLALKGSSYNGLLQRHNIHSENVEHVVQSLRNEGIDVRVVRRRDYDEETGTGTMLLAASKVLDKVQANLKGHLCLPVLGGYTRSFPEALHKLYRGDSGWQWRQRIRLFLEGTEINLTPVDLHEQHFLTWNSTARPIVPEVIQSKHLRLFRGPHLLPVRALNEVFIGESLSSRANYKFCKPRFTFSFIGRSLLLRDLSGRRALGEAEELRTERLHWDRNRKPGNVLGIVGCQRSL
ncbi:unnamed protein product [Ranitomeya imitator]|uniref:Uncharacterized protein n=1 Tax=Ranitomeya imitator TaxID=111125 RepID=A0ABN9M7E0_9NEOB|nr:unnamed protein product [Ranitomeya imitator]